MYDRLFSQQWLFDRCLEGSNVYYQLSTPTAHGVIALIIIAVMFLLVVKRRHILPFIAVVILGIFLYLVIPFGGFLFCSASRMYLPAIDAAHALHGVMKTYHDAGVPWPANAQALRAMDPGDYDTMVANAKVAYVTDPKNDRFTLFVRPSKYSMVIFDSLYDFRNYSFQDAWEGEYQFPPSYPGPWDQLPK